MVGLLKVAEAGLALGPKGRFQSEAEKELRPGACEEAAGANERSPTILVGLLNVAEAGLEHATSRL